MGTDIRLYPEQYVDGRWQFIGEMEKNSLYELDPEHEPRSYPKDLYDIRNYGLFAILADVRNDEGYECIALRRGIPVISLPRSEAGLSTIRATKRTRPRSYKMRSSVRVGLHRILTCSCSQVG